MQLKFIYFGALVICILKTARANIPGCDFSETVNISSSQKLDNGSYIYQGLLVPPSWTEEYDFIETEQGAISVNSHVRACVCKLRPCLWFCCRFRHMQANGECTDGLMEKLNKIKAYVNVTLRNGSVVGGTLPSDFIVLGDQIRFLEFWSSVYVKGKGTTIFIRGYDCLHPNQFRSGNTKPLVVAIHTPQLFGNSVLHTPELTLLFWLSEVLLLFTIAVYLYVKKLGNLHGKCFICHMIAKFMAQLQWWLIFCRIPLQLCALYGYCFYYFLMAKYLWLLGMSYQMWKGFTSVNRHESQYSFQAYSIFAWGTAAGMTGFLFLIDQIWEGKPNKVKWIPGMGWDHCCLQISSSLHLYVSGPITILLTLNTAFFILTTISIVKVKLSLKHFSDQKETARNLSSRMETYKMFLRLFFVMDIQDIVGAISYIFFWENLLTISYYFNLWTGIFIFVLFVLKRSTIRLLMESIRNRGN